MLLRSKGNSSASLFPLSPNSNFSLGFESSFLPPCLPPSLPSFLPSSSSSSASQMQLSVRPRYSPWKKARKTCLRGKSREFSVSFCRKTSGRWVVGDVSFPALRTTRRRRMRRERLSAWPSF